MERCIVLLEIVQRETRLAPLPWLEPAAAAATPDPTTLCSLLLTVLLLFRAAFVDFLIGAVFYGSYI